MKRLFLSLGLVALAAVLAACSGAAAAPPAGSPAAPSAGAGDGHDDRGQGPRVPADTLSRRGRHRLRGGPRQPGGAPHNIAIKDAAGAEVFKGEIVANAR